MKQDGEALEHASQQLRGDREVVCMHHGNYVTLPGLHAMGRGAPTHHRCATLGNEHPDTLGALGELATLLQGTGRTQEAEALYREVLQGRRMLLSPLVPGHRWSDRLLLGRHRHPFGPDLLQVGLGFRELGVGIRCRHASGFEIRSKLAAAASASLVRPCTRSTEDWTRAFQGLASFRESCSRLTASSWSAMASAM